MHTPQRDRPINLAEFRALRRGSVPLAWMHELEKIADEFNVHLWEVVNLDLEQRAYAYQFLCRWGREETVEEMLERLAGETGEDLDDLRETYAAIEAGERECY